MHLLETRRLAFVPFTREMLKAALEDRARLAELLGASIPEIWPYGDFADAIPFMLKGMEEQPDTSGWGGLLIHKTDQVLIGDLGFHGPPDETGTVEVGYSIVPAYRKQGYATEATSCLVQWALRQREIIRVIAQCRKDNLGSIRVLEKVGMRQLKPEGSMLQWEICRGS